MIALLIANSLALASLIMLASGLALIYGLRDVINFGHGAIYMLGAYLGYTVSLVGGFWLALIVVPILLALLGIAFEYLALRPLQGRVAYRRSAGQAAVSALSLDRSSSSSMAASRAASMRRRSCRVRSRS